MKISDIMNEQELERHIAEGLVSKRKHPTLPLYILNYTAAVQFAWTWNDVTLNCRGLVVDEDNNIIARSFPKFFSYEQLDGKLPQGKYIVEEKLDGSMLLVFKYADEIITATRGSFESEQAIKAKDFLGHFMPLPSESWIFEVIYKDNRIVVDYDYEGLVLLDVNDTRTKELSDLIALPSVLDTYAEHYNFRRPKIYSFDSLEDILNHSENNIEGFVLHYASGERVKIKTDDYKRLHRLITGVSEKTVWEALKDNKFNELIENVPDEFYNWVHEVKAKLESDYLAIEQSAKSAFVDLGDRKKNALWYQKQNYPAILFKMLDKQDYSSVIWKMIRPEVTQVFKMVSENSN